MKKYFLLTLALLATTPSYAALGETVTSMHATKYQLTTNHSYKVETYQIQTATTIREYINKDGKVFAVTWSGPIKPNLNQLLGHYYPTLKTASLKRPRSSIYIHHPTLVIESNGHPMSFFGRAYLPNAMPAGITAADIQ